MINQKKTISLSGSIKDSIAYARYTAYFSCVISGNASKEIGKKFFSAIDKTNEAKVGSQIADLITKDKSLSNLDCVNNSLHPATDSRFIIYGMCCSIESCASRFKASLKNKPSDTAK